MSQNSELLRPYGIAASHVLRNTSVPVLYEKAVQFDGGEITSSGSLATTSGEKYGRSPTHKRVVDNPESSGNVWWGSVNMKMPPKDFQTHRRNAIAALNSCDQLYVLDGFAGWDPKYRVKVRVVTSRPYHALFMHNMLIRPTADELKSFGEPDFVIFNAGAFPADPKLDSLTDPTGVALNLESKELVIMGTEYAGEMKKGVFTAMNYWMPEQGIFSMHCSASESNEGDVSLFFGLSGTGKTTLSADPHRRLVGDDEHCWSDNGIFNIEGGCYAKCINLREESEPQIYRAIRFGTVLENVVYDKETRIVDFEDGSITENTRASYPIEFIDNAEIPCVANHPNNIIFLTCDAFGVLPPVSKLTSAQAMYHFISGYTAKVAGTEVGVSEPVATFSSCYGAAFLVWHPAKYAEMLQEQMRKHQADAWLINTGWTGGGYGVGERMPLKFTRGIIDAIHSGELAGRELEVDPIFGLAIPQQCSGCPSELLNPRNTWRDKNAFDQAAQQLAKRFHDHFSQYEDEASDDIRAAGPTAGATA